jgi:predicted dehydrogenase
MTADVVAGSVERGRPRRRTRQALRVAIVGFGWMGRVHANAYLTAVAHFPDLDVQPLLAWVVDEVPGRAAEGIEQYGFEHSGELWSDAVSDPTVDAVSITLPNFLHRSVGIACAQAGKHIWIEKPVGTSLSDTVAVAEAVSAAGTQAAVGFNYRNAPAVVLARDLIGSGELGEVTHARFQLFSDYAAHPKGALTWRFERDRGGAGVVGDLATHGVDLASHLLGTIEAVVADTETFVKVRPRPLESHAGHALALHGPPGVVENEDYMACLMRLNAGARVVLQVSRVSVGSQNAYSFEVHGTRGAVYWDFRRMGELGVSSGPGFQDQSVRKIYVGPSHGSYGAFQPGAALSMSYDDLKVIEAYRFLQAIKGEGHPAATMTDAVRNAAVLEAIARSADCGRWVDVVEPMGTGSPGAPLARSTERNECI